MSTSRFHWVDVRPEYIPPIPKTTKAPKNHCRWCYEPRVEGTERCPKHQEAAMR